MHVLGVQYQKFKPRGGGWEEEEKGLGGGGKYGV